MKILVLALIFTSCASMKIEELNKPDRTFTMIQELKTTKNNNYDGAINWLSKHMINSNYAIKMKDKEQGKIVSKINYTCMKYRENGFGQTIDLPIDFTVDIAFKAKRVKVEIVADSYEINAGSYGVRRFPISIGEKNDIKKCQVSLYNEILAGMNSEKSSNDW